MFLTLFCKALIHRWIGTLMSGTLKYFNSITKQDKDTLNFYKRVRCVWHGDCS